MFKGLYLKSGIVGDFDFVFTQLLNYQMVSTEKQVAIGSERKNMIQKKPKKSNSKTEVQK